MAYPNYLFPTEEEAAAYVAKVNSDRGLPRPGGVTITWATPAEKAEKWAVPEFEGIAPDSPYELEEAGNE